MEAAATMIFLFLPLALVVAGLIVGVLFVREAFLSRAERVPANWAVSLPLLGGEALRRWASEFAERIVSVHAKDRQTPQAAVALAQEVESQASRVLERSLPESAIVREPQCAARESQAIYVTVPETLAIVDELQHNAMPYELRRVRNRARRNVRRLAEAEAGASAATICPLLAENQHCAIYAARPLYCRGRCCPNCDQPADDRSAAGNSPQAFAATLGEGISEGLSQGLTNAGLDGRQYELNRALVKALSVPDAGERWLRGEAVFESC